MKIGIAQINTVIGDFEGNIDRCLSAIHRAEEDGAELVIFPEMAIPGYPPRDLLFDSSFNQAVFEATQDLASKCVTGPAVVIGTLMPSGLVQPDHPELYNAAVLLQAGEFKLAAAKRLLPAYDVFHEPRWFLPGPFLPPIDFDGFIVGFMVCEDLWDEGYPIHPSSELIDSGAELLVCLSASPYRKGVMQRRLHHARRQACDLVYVNMCGANDELIFDGRSFIMDVAGNLTTQMAAFEEQVSVFDLTRLKQAERETMLSEEIHFKALSLGIKDFVHKNKLERAFVGVSGGIDSAVVAVLAVDALGPTNVNAICIPSRYTDERSVTSAQELARNLGIELEVVPLENLHRMAESTLENLLDRGTTAENIQARLRAMVLMAFVNHHGGVLLNTSNKTELTLGYATLYGDMAGSLCPIGDLTKTEIYELADWINAKGPLIPAFSQERLPSAELKADQVDPFDYPVISPQLESLVLENRSNQAIKLSEHKRWHVGVILKVSEKSFGTGRLVPITKR
jgi:NAD+ synthase (glutamine-hydrolysing)